MTPAKNETALKWMDMATGEKSETLLKATPHLNLLRRRQSKEEMTSRALQTMWQQARRVLTVEFDTRDDALAEAMVNKLVELLKAGTLLDKFDADRGRIEGFTYGVLKKLALECFRRRSRERIDDAREVALLPSQASPVASAADSAERLTYVRQWTMQLSRSQRDAVARRFEALADLDSGSEIPNQGVTLHRALKRLREKARELDRVEGGG
jgi:hypothetical protein